MSSPVVRARLTAGIAVAVFGVSAPVALASRNSIGDHTVTASQGANVRASSASGGPTSVYRGHLKRGEHFVVTRHDGSFCFGKAGGKVKRTGWVLCGALSK